MNQPHPYYHGNYAPYGNMYFTPSMMKKNDPVKLDSSKHVAVVVVSILLLAAIIVCAIGFNNFLSALAFGLILGLTYLLYIIIAICCSDTRGYITNLKRFDEYMIREIIEMEDKSLWLITQKYQAIDYHSVGREQTVRKSKRMSALPAWGRSTTPSTGNPPKPVNTT